MPLSVSVYQQPHPQLSPQPQLPKPPQSRRMMIRITIQEVPPQPQPLLQPQPISRTSFPVSKPYYETAKKVLQIPRKNISILSRRLLPAPDRLHNQPAKRRISPEPLPQVCQAYPWVLPLPILQKKTERSFLYL